MWNPEKSAKLSLYLTDAIAVIVVLTAVFCPQLVNWYLTVTGKSGILKTVLIASVYSCIPAALVLLFCLRKLLKNIMKNLIFISSNVTLLRVISWCCALVSLITLAAGYFYMPFYFVGVAAGFFTLIIRVIKNVFSAAMEIKSENELTI